MNRDLLLRLLRPGPLSAAEVRSTFDALLAMATEDADRAALLVALEARTLSAGELASFAKEMLRRARPFPLPPGDRAMDLCGTGGAPRPSFNVSTASAFVVAAAGVPVVKHGNRSARGPCGSSDLLAALGLPVTTSTAFARATYRRHRLAFLHAPLYHPATAVVVPVRRRLGIPTIFNRLGPISNPARVRYHVTGARDLATARALADVLPRLGVVRGITMVSEDGTDEFSPRARTSVLRWGPEGQTSRTTLRPDTLLYASERRGPWGPLPPRESARETRRLLAGDGGSRLGSVLLTSGAALWLAARVGSLASGVEAARATVADGAPLRLLEALEAMAPAFREAPS